MINANIKLSLTRTRKGNLLKMTHSGKANKTELKIDGITTMQELLQALETQIQFHLPSIIELFEGELSTAEERVEVTRIKEMEHQRKVRALQKEVS